MTLQAQAAKDGSPAEIKGEDSSKKSLKAKAVPWQSAAAKKAIYGLVKADGHTSQKQKQQFRQHLQKSKDSCKARQRSISVKQHCKNG